MATDGSQSKKTTNFNRETNSGLSAENKHYSDENEADLGNELRKLCDEKSGKEKEPKKSAEILHKLGLLYSKRNTKIDFINAACLLNAAISRKPDNVESIKHDLKSLCFKVLEVAGAHDTKADLVAASHKVKSEVKDMRDFVNEKLQGMKESSAELNSEIEKEEEKISQIRKLQDEITSKYTEVMANLLKYCEKVMGAKSYGYSLVGMGSLARKEITPYSDFEHIIVLEEDYQQRSDYQQILDYFRWLSVIFQIVIINLQETILPNVDVDCLKHRTNSGKYWFFDGITTRGICFDSMLPHTCKFPLGGQKFSEGKLRKTELIKPVDEMLKYLDFDEDLKNGYHIRDILTKVCYVGGNHEIFEKFQTKLYEKLESEDYQTKVDNVKKMLVEDMDSFTSRSNFLNFSSKTFNIKKDFYRCSSIFVSSLGQLHNITASSCFEISEELAKKGVVSESVKRKQMYAVALACELRLRWYMKKGMQDDIMDGENPNPAQAILSVINASNMVKYYHIVYALQCDISKRLNLKKIYFYTDPNLLNFKLFYRFQQYPKFKELLKSYSPKPINKTSKLYSFEETFAQFEVKTETDIYSQITQANAKNDDEKTELEKGIYSLAQKCMIAEVNIAADLLLTFRSYFEEHFFQKIDTAEEVKTFNTAKEVKTINTAEEVKTINTAEEVNTISTTEEVKTNKTAEEVETIKTAEEVETIKTAEEVKTIKTAQEDKTINTEEEVKTINTAEEVKTINTAEEVKTIKTAEEVKTINTAEEVKTINTAEEVKTFNTAEEVKTIRIVDHINNIKKNLTPTLHCYLEELYYQKRWNKFKADLSSFHQSRPTSSLGQELSQNSTEPEQPPSQEPTAKDFTQNLEKDKLIEVTIEEERIIFHFGLFFRNLGCNDESNEMFMLCYEIMKDRLCSYSKDVRQIFKEKSTSQTNEYLESLDKSLLQNVKLDLMTSYNFIETVLKISRYLSDMNKHEEALAYSKLLLKLLETDAYFLGSTLSLEFKALILHNIGASFVSMHNSCEALNYLQKALKIFQEEKELNDPKYYAIKAQILNRIGHCLKELHKFDEAISNLKQSLELMEQLLPNTDLNMQYATMLSQTGCSLMEMNEHDEALSYLKRSLGIMEQESRDLNTNEVYAWFLNNVGSCYLRMHKYKHALAYFEKSLKIKENVSLDLSSDIDVSSTLHNIGKCLTAMQRPRDAMDFLRRSLEITNKSSSGSIADQFRLGIFVALADCLMKLEEHDEAKACMEQALRIAEVKSFDHSRYLDLAKSLNSMGKYCLKTQNITGALDYFNESLKIFKAAAINPSQDSKVAGTENNIGCCLISLFKFEEGLTHLQTSLDIADAISWDCSCDFDVGRTLCNIGSCLVDLNRPNEALMSLTRSLSTREQVSTDLTIDGDYATILFHIGRCFLLEHKSIEASSYFKRTLEIKKKISVYSSLDYRSDKIVQAINLLIDLFLIQV